VGFVGAPGSSAVDILKSDYRYTMVLDEGRKDAGGAATNGRVQVQVVMRRRCH
jgi:hypothetical protein